MTSALDLVLQHPAVWRGNDCARVAVPSVPTGFAELDAWLPGGGWPAGALTEIYAERLGIGELRLVMPAAARLTQSERWITLVAPPCLPYAPALAAHGVKLERLLLVQVPTVDESLWACEQALRAGGCGAVLAWLSHIHERAVKRLQLAAEASGALALLFRSARVIPASPAALRLHVGKSGGRTVVRILKRRGGGVPAPVALDLHGAIAGRDKIKNKLAAHPSSLPLLPKEEGKLEPPLSQFGRGAGVRVERRWTPIQREELATENTENERPGSTIRDPGVVKSGDREIGKSSFPSHALTLSRPLDSL